MVIAVGKWILDHVNFHCFERHLQYSQSGHHGPDEAHEEIISFGSQSSTLSMMPSSNVNSQYTLLCFVHWMPYTLACLYPHEQHLCKYNYVH